MKPLFPDVELSVVIPAYNEEANIGTMLPRAVESLRRCVGACELLVIDDCSRDRTGDVAREVACRYPEIKVLRNETNLRQGGTLRRGFALARYDLVTHNAADYPFDFEDLPALLAHFPAADIVVAGRLAYPGITASRRFVSFANRSLLKLLFGTKVKDYNFIQIYKRSVLESQRCFSQATSFITPEKIIRAHHAGLRVVEVEVEYRRHEIGKGSSANLKNIRRALADMGRLWLELHGIGAASSD